MTLDPRLWATCAARLGMREALDVWHGRSSMNGFTALEWRSLCACSVVCGPKRVCECKGALCHQTCCCMAGDAPALLSVPQGAA